jgi:Leucine-rich repeat (LRR) protein
MNKKLLYVSFLVFLLLQTVAIAQIPEDEKSALIDLYEATNGDSWTIKWNLKLPVDQWYGVDIIDGHVIGLNLYKNNLIGKIPASLKNLKNLEVLDCAFNTLEGTLPDELSDLGQLKVLKLEMNGLQGKLPENFTSMLNLEELILFDNKLEGNIPESISAAKNLKILDLSNNYFEGNLPENMASLVKLTNLGLSGNKLEGEINFSFGRMRNLSELLLSFNNFHGAVPEGIQSLTELQFVQLQGNDFTSFESLQDMQSVELVAFDTDDLNLNIKYHQLHEIDVRMANTIFDDVE